MKTTPTDQEISQAVDILLNSSSPQDILEATKKYPFLREQYMIESLEQMARGIQPELSPILIQWVMVLKQITSPEWELIDKGVSLYEKANKYSEIGDTANAIQCYEQSLVILKKTSNLMAVAVALYNFAVLCQRIGKFDQALSMAQEAEQRFNNINELGNAQKARRLIETMRQPSKLKFDTELSAFLEVNSYSDMQKIVKKYKSMKTIAFIMDVENFIDHRLPTEFEEYKDSLLLRLSWLRDIANTPQESGISGFVNKLFGKKK